MLKQPVKLILSIFVSSSITSCIFDSGSDQERFYALNFDGVDDTLVLLDTTSALNNISHEMTIESWIYARTLPTSFPRIVDRSDNIAGIPLGDRFLLALAAEDTAAHINVNGYSVTSNRIFLNQWTHIAGTFDGKTLRIYVDGNLTNSANITTTIDVRDSLLYIGNNSLGNRQFGGYIDEVRIWNIALDSARIKSNMERILSGTEAGLIAYWRMDEGSGQIVQDTAGENDGQLGLQSIIDKSDPTWVEVAFPHSK